MHRPPPPSADQALKATYTASMRYTEASRLVHAAVAVGAAPGASTARLCVRLLALQKIPMLTLYCKRGAWGLFAKPRRQCAAAAWVTFCLVRIRQPDEALLR
ncbi:hypothetical protein [Paenibacillus xylanexedens]|uniref:hypothetical protein n=1 Tax=Paenibacillus xylanexedens TaxID=528191 RepID=UPI0011AAD89A|nr:hypothetical protein [Paenibacillus xylanexedens]